MALVESSSQTGKWTYEPSMESRSSPHKRSRSCRTVAPLQEEQFSVVPGWVTLSWQHSDLDAVPPHKQQWNLRVVCSGQQSTLKTSISSSQPRNSQYHRREWTWWPVVAKTKTNWAKGAHTALHQMLVPLLGGNKSARGEWETVRRWLCLHAPPVLAGRSGFT